ncbi:MAG: hypothetical protein INR73_16540 [Williamsia sp.]|nr:hypothetical protein [Williamsia sp.]
MQPYKSNSTEPSGVTGYEIGKNFINIQFSDGSVYQYTYVTAGTAAVETMKQLAQKSQGLSTFITQHRPGFKQLD